MSENKDLEIIKSEVDFLDKYMADHELDERLNAILVHAARMVAEIARLKAELEKRPEVVRCGECKKKDLGFTCPLVCANAVIKAKTKAENFILFDDNDFCSAGQRRESKEGK